MDTIRKNLAGLVKDLARAKVLVVGDLMLDHYVYGDVRRTAPESLPDAPVPVLSATNEAFILGGAGCVVANLQGLGARPQVLGAVAADAAGDKIAALIRECGGDSESLTIVSDRPSTVKMRFMTGVKLLLRTDYEKASPLTVEAEKDLTGKIGGAMKDCGAVIISDYGKGVITPAVIAAVLEEARHRNIPVLVDPKGKDFTIYRGVNFITPNASELSEAVQMPTGTDVDVIAAARALMRAAGIDTIIAKRSEKGMSIVTADTVLHLPATATQVLGVAGAGDSVIATLAAALAVKIPLENAAMLANEAAGLTVEKPGTTPVSQTDLLDRLSRASDNVEKSSYQAPVHEDWHQARQQIDGWKAQGLKVGFTNGCFDILHYGHVNYLNRARARCDRLVVGLNADSSITRLKGAGRPVHEELSRGAVIAALGAIDMVVIFGDDKADDDKPIRVIDALRPDVCFKGGDYKVEDLPEAQVILSYGGQVEIMPLYEGHSTTAAIRKMKKTG